MRSSTCATGKTSTEHWICCWTHGKEPSSWSRFRLRKAICSSLIHYARNVQTASSSQPSMKYPCFRRKNFHSSYCSPPDCVRVPHYWLYWRINIPTPCWCSHKPSWTSLPCRSVSSRKTFYREEDSMLNVLRIFVWQLTSIVYLLLCDCIHDLIRLNK